MKGVVVLDWVVGEDGISLVFRHRMVRSIPGTRRTIGVSLFPLLQEGEGSLLTSALCAIRVYVLLSRVEIATEEVPAVASGNAAEATNINLSSRGT